MRRGGEYLRDICTAWQSRQYLGERGDEEVAKAVTVEVALVEAILEELGEQVLVLRERDHAVADVAGGKHLKSSRRRPEEPPSSVT